MSLKKIINIRAIRLLLLFLIFSRLASGCICEATKISGRVTYDFVPEVSASGTASALLDYNAIEKKPARRVVVQLVDVQGNVTAETFTDDDGNYYLPLEITNYQKVRVLAELKAANYGADRISPDACAGSSWNISVYDGLYDLSDSSLLATEKQIGLDEIIDIHVSVDPQSAAIEKRAAAPFAILDSILTEMEKVCESKPSQNFPQLYVYWSPANRASYNYKPSVGDIVTTHFNLVLDTAGNSYPALFILGEKDVDTDEYNRHVIAHEFAHYLESQVFRSDSIGGAHGYPDSLDARVAFSEGFANAMSAISFNDPIYIDTSGDGEASGFQLMIDEPPAIQDVTGIYSELAIHSFLWSLYENSDTANHSGNASKILSVLDMTKTSDAFVTLQSFAAYYNEIYGAASENLQSLWQNPMLNDFNSLCAGLCSGSGDTADSFDFDNDMGNLYAAQLHYPPDTGFIESAAFWRLYMPLAVGSSGAGVLDLNDGAFSSSHSNYPYNKKGAHQYFVIDGNGNAITVSNSCVDAANTPISMDIYYKNLLVATEDGASGCGGSLTFNSEASKKYIVDVNVPSSVYSFLITPGIYDYIVYAN